MNFILFSAMSAFVSSCPKTEEEFFQASKRFGCGSDTRGHNTYICIPNQDKTSLVELCYNEGMGIREKGIRLKMECWMFYPNKSYTSLLLNKCYRIYSKIT